MEPIYCSSSVYYDRCPNEPIEQVVVTIPRRYGPVQRLLPTRCPSMMIYHPYPNWIGMVEEHSLVAPSFPPSVAPQIPHKVYEQLSNDFLPAAKNVGQAGMQLLRAYHGLQDSLSVYCDAIHKLIRSADSADAKSKSEMNELSKVFREFVQGVEYHNKIVAEFETLALKVNDYSQKDKEKLKAEYHDYKKDEKKVLKQKHSGADAEKNVFYQRSASDWSRQQELRYRFFNEKVHAWINCYSEMGKHLQGDIVAHAPEIVQQPILITPIVEEPSDWHDHLHEEAAAEIKEEQEHKEEVENHQPQVQVVTKQRTVTASTDSSVATTLDELPSHRMTIETPGVTLVSTQKRESVEDLTTPSNFYGRTPMIPPPQNHYTSIERTPSIHSVSIQPPVIPIPAPRREEYDNRQSVNNYVSDVPRRDVVSTRNGKILHGAVPVFGLMGGELPNRYTPRKETSDYQVVTRDRIPVGRVVDTVPLTEEQMNVKKFHVESNYVAQASPAHQLPNNKRNESDPIAVQSFFNPSQYGSILIVNDDFNASSKEQMTVNRGDKVILLKCGSRGWVFVRDSVSNRTGWLPEPYVNP